LPEYERFHLEYSFSLFFSLCSCFFLPLESPMFYA
jgi:hypothetical protein